jgi:hypothetical protein
MQKIKIKSNLLWKVRCGDWTSAGYDIRSDAMRTKRTLDVGDCSCDNHEPYCLFIGE